MTRRRRTPRRAPVLVMAKLNADTNKLEKEKLKSEYEYFLEMKEKFREYAQKYINTIKDEQFRATCKTELNKQLSSFDDNESFDEYVQRITKRTKIRGMIFPYNMKEGR